MTEATVADLEQVFSSDLSLQTYSQLRDTALANEGNANRLEQLADGIDPKGPGQATKKGIAYWILGRTQTAIELLEKGHPKEELASTFLGRAFLDMEKPAEAKLKFREALAEHPDSAPIAFGLVHAVIQLGELEEAMDILERAEGRFGTNFYTTFLRGYHAEQTGEYEEARELYERSLEQGGDTPNPQALFRLARYHQTWGEEEQSRDKIVERLPPITRWLFAASTVVRQPVCLVFMAAGFVAAVVFLVRKISKMGEAYDEFMFSIPLFGTLFEQAALMKVTQTMRDLLLNGVSMVETLRLSANTVGRNRLHHKLEELRQAVEEGGSFSRNLSAGDVFPDTMVWKLQLAEEKGIIEDALAELSHEFNVGVDRQTTLITKFLSPLLLVFMGGVVFLMFLACFVPLTQIYAGG